MSIPKLPTGWVETGGILFYRMISGADLFKWEMKDGYLCLDISNDDYHLSSDGKVLTRADYAMLGPEIPPKGISFYTAPAVREKMLRFFENGVKPHKGDIMRLRASIQEMEENINSNCFPGGKKPKDPKKRLRIMQEGLATLEEIKKPAYTQRFGFIRSGESAIFDFYVDNNPPGHALLIPKARMTRREYFWALAEIGFSSVKLQSRRDDGKLMVMILDKNLEWVVGGRWLEADNCSGS